MNNEGLILRCQQGEREAFELLFKQYHSKAKQTAYLITRRKELAEDAVQEAFIQCYRQLGSLRNRELFHVWFYRLLLRVSIRLMKKEKKKGLVFSNDIELLPDQKENAYEAVNYKEIYQKLYEALETLPDSHRAVIILHYFNELSIKEISDVLSCRQGTVKSRLHNARKKLSEKLEKEGLSFTYFYVDEEKGEHSHVREMVESHVK